VSRALIAFVLFLPIGCSNAHKDAAAFNKRGLAYNEKQEYDKAIDDFSEAIRLNPKDAIAFGNRGNAYDSKQEFDKAIADYSEAIRIDPKRALAFALRGMVYTEKKDYDKAIADFSEAIRLDPKNAAAFRNRGVAYYRKKDYDKAIADYSEAIRLDPKNAAAFVIRGVAYRKRQEYDKAIQDYSEAVRLDPRNANASRNLAWFLAACPKDSLRDGKRAVQLATQTCELSGWKLPVDLDILAAAHAECGDFQEAIKWQKKAIELGFEDKEKEKAVKRLKLYEEGKPYRLE